MNRAKTGVFPCLCRFNILKKAAMDTIFLESVIKRYRADIGRTEKTVLDNLSFCVKEGTVFGFLGPNGAGKSTTIKILLDFIRPDSGRVLINGVSPDCHEVRKDIGYMSEKPCTYVNMTIMELLSFRASVTGAGKRRGKGYADELLEKTGLVEHKNRPLKNFSKGMLQRASLALALVHDPQILILDEPLSGLDPLMRYEVIGLLRDLKEEGKTIFLSSHILNDIEKVCDEIAILNNGRILFVGRIDDVSIHEGLEEFFVKTLMAS